MAFACQRDSYLKSFNSLVVSCVEADLTFTASGKKCKERGYEIVLEDTILFPEGGGQPYDLGRIGGVDIVAVVRRGERAVHYAHSPVEVGDDVEVVVDWARRFDHMQQHSGQHLITAVCDEMLGAETVSWSLGEETCSVELDAGSVSPDQVKGVEGRVNELIRRALPVRVTLYDKADLDKMIPTDAAGPIRVVSMGGLDENPCCGTHVSNLSHLQVIKILAAEKGKRGHTNLTFICGGRVLERVGRDVEYQREMGSILRGGVGEHVKLAAKLQASAKEGMKTNRALMKELARVQIELFKYKHGAGQFKNLFSLHSSFGDIEFMHTIAREINSYDPSIIVFLTVRDSRSSKGLFLVSGMHDIVASNISNLLDGKGASKNGIYQGKCNNLNNISKVETYLNDEIIKNKF